MNCSFHHNSIIETPACEFIRVFLRIVMIQSVRWPVFRTSFDSSASIRKIAAQPPPAIRLSLKYSTIPCSGQLPELYHKKPPLIEGHHAASPPVKPTTARGYARRRASPLGVIQLVGGASISSDNRF